MTDVLMQQLPHVSFLERLEALIDGSVLDEATRADLRLRVLADHFLAREDHAEAELAALGDELASAVAGASQGATDAVAPRLVTHPQTGAGLHATLLARGGATARAVLGLARDFDAATLGQAASHGDAATATAVAARADLTSEITTILFRRPEREVLVALLRNQNCHLDRATASWLITRARHDDELARALLARGPIGCDLTPLFLTADAATRAKILADVRRRDLGGVPTPRRVAPAALVAALQMALDGRKRAALVDVLARDQRISRQDAQRLIADASAEPFALLLNVAGIPMPLAARLLSWIAAVPAGSAALVPLERLACELPPQSARRVVAAIVGRAIAAGDATRRQRPVADMESVPVSPTVSRPTLQSRAR